MYMQMYIHTNTCMYMQMPTLAHRETHTHHSLFTEEVGDTMASSDVDSVWKNLLWALLGLLGSPQKPCLVR